MPTAGQALLASGSFSDFFILFRVSGGFPGLGLNIEPQRVSGDKQVNNTELKVGTGRVLSCISFICSSSFPRLFRSLVKSCSGLSATVLRMTCCSLVEDAQLKAWCGVQGCELERGLRSGAGEPTAEELPAAAGERWPVERSQRKGVFLV